jgi:hypothetical protein
MLEMKLRVEALAPELGARLSAIVISVWESG